MKLLKSPEKIKEEMERDIRDQDKTPGNTNFWVVVFLCTIPWAVYCIYVIINLI